MKPIVIGFLIGFLVLCGYGVGRLHGEIHGMKEVMQKAVEFKVAEYYLSEDGKSKFRWITH